jgi:hypothetical protein
MWCLYRHVLASYMDATLSCSRFFFFFFLSCFDFLLGNSHIVFTNYQFDSLVLPYSFTNLGHHPRNRRPQPVRDNQGGTLLRRTRWKISGKSSRSTRVQKLCHQQEHRFIGSLANCKDKMERLKTLTNN